MSSPSDLRCPALHESHTAAGAKFANFAGWQMPLQYPDGVLAEHAAVRERAGVFDVSHLGTVWLTGTGVVDFVNECFTADLNRIGTGKAQYTLCCNDSGGVVDDLIVYRLADDELLCVPNAANTSQVVQLLRAAAPSGVEIRDDHGAHAIIAVQGPDSTRLLQAVGLPTPDTYLSFQLAHSGVVDAVDGTVMVCRSGYTGERGYELIVAAPAATPLWNALLRAGESFSVLPCGLAARDTLRTEMGYPLHGHELTPEVTPTEAGLGWAVGWSKPTFWGRDALVEQRRTGIPRRSVGLTLPHGTIARPGMSVRERPGADIIGTVTSGTFSPSLRTPIALALLAVPGQADTELPSTVNIEVRGRSVEARVTKPPFVQPNGLR